MNNLILIMLAVIVIMGAVIYALVRDRRASKKEIEKLNNILSSAKNNIEQLTSYIDKIQKIKTEGKTITQQIKEAKNDEEIFSIIANIVSDNNSRVQNYEG